MKRFFFSLAGIAIVAVLFAFNNHQENTYVPVNTEAVIEIPAEVFAVIDKKCYGCHNTESRGEKSKKKLNWDYFTNGEYNNVKIFAKLGKIEKILGENKMPPAKFLEKYPDKTLTDDEHQLLLSWAKKQKETLQNE